MIGLGYCRLLAQLIVHVDQSAVLGNPVGPRRRAGPRSCHGLVHIIAAGKPRPCAGKHHGANFLVVARQLQRRPQLVFHLPVERIAHSRPIEGDQYAVALFFK